MRDVPGNLLLPDKMPQKHWPSPACGLRVLRKQGYTKAADAFESVFGNTSLRKIRRTFIVPSRFSTRYVYSYICCLPYLNSGVFICRG